MVWFVVLVVSVLLGECVWHSRATADECGEE